MNCFACFAGISWQGKIQGDGKQEALRQRRGVETLNHVLKHAVQRVKNVSKQETNMAGSNLCGNRMWHVATQPS